LKPVGDQASDKPKKQRKALKPRGRYPLSETPQNSVKMLRKDPLLSLLLDGEPAGLRPVQDDARTTSEAVVKVEKAVCSLGQLESEVISALFPADGSAPASFENIAERLGMTAEEVKGIADNALRGLRGTRGTSRISKAWN
jgi:hypothetical protein